MQAARIYEYGGPDVLKFESDAPAPVISPDSLLIEAAATSVNPIDWKVRSGARQKDFPLDFPAILGRDVSGVVREVGSTVRDFKVGDRVLAMANATYAQIVAAPAAVTAHLPADMDLTDAAAIPLISLTGNQLVRNATQAAEGQTILVTGALGSVGRAAVHAAKKLGAKVIAGVRARQLAEAETLGVFRVLGLDDEDALTQLGTVDGVADTVGGETAARLFPMVRNGGRFGYASVLPDGLQAQFPTVEIARVFARPDAATLREFADDMREGSFLLPISQRLPLSQAATAHEQLEKGGGGKIVLTI